MKKVAIVGLGWLGMPLALSLMARGWEVKGSKTTQDGVEAARKCGVDCCQLQLRPELECDSETLDALLNVDALVVTLPARRSGPGDDFYLLAVQELVDSALARHVPRILFTSSTSVYGEVNGVVKEPLPLTHKHTARRNCVIWNTGCTICQAHRSIFCALQAWWGPIGIQGVSWPGRRCRAAIMWSTWCIWMMLLLR